MRTGFPGRDVCDSLLASVTQDGSARTSPMLYRTLLKMLADGNLVFGPILRLLSPGRSRKSKAPLLDGRIGNTTSWIISSA